MARSTYHDQFHKLVDRGYLVLSRGNTYEFYEVPQAATQTKNPPADGGLNFEENPSIDELIGSGGYGVLPEDIEINNMTDTTNIPGINNGLTETKEIIQKPQVKEIVISRPVAEGKNRPKAIKQAEFVF